MLSTFSWALIALLPNDCVLCRVSLCARNIRTWLTTDWSHRNTSSRFSRRRHSLVWRAGGSSSMSSTILSISNSLFGYELTLDISVKFEIVNIIVPFLWLIHVSHKSKVIIRHILNSNSIINQSIEIFIGHQSNFLGIYLIKILFYVDSSFN